MRYRFEIMDGTHVAKDEQRQQWPTREHFSTSAHYRKARASLFRVTQRSKSGNGVDWWLGRWQNGERRSGQALLRVVFFPRRRHSISMDGAALLSVPKSMTFPVDVHHRQWRPCWPCSFCREATLKILFINLLWEKNNVLWLINSSE